MLLLLLIGEIASWYQLHTLFPSRSTLHIRQKFQWTSEQLKAAYLDLQYFHRRSPRCPTECLSLLLEWFTPYSFCTLFWVSRFYLSINIVVLFQIHGHVYRKLRVLSLKSEVSRTEKKGSRLRFCFRVVDDVPEKKRMDLWKQMSSSRWSFTCICEIFFALKPFHDYNLCSVCILPQPAFYSQSAVCIYPWSAVCSPQSAVRSPQSAVRSPQSTSYTDRCFIDS